MISDCHHVKPDAGSAPLRGLGLAIVSGSSGKTGRHDGGECRTNVNQSAAAITLPILGLHLIAELKPKHDTLHIQPHVKAVLRELTKATHQARGAPRPSIERGKVPR